VTEDAEATAGAARSACPFPLFQRAWYPAGRLAHHGYQPNNTAAPAGQLVTGEDTVTSATGWPVGKKRMPQPGSVTK
jgi:hypothetical protein